jgi:hypothetical protein
MFDYSTEFTTNKQSTNIRYCDNFFTLANINQFLQWHFFHEVATSLFASNAAQFFGLRGSINIL